MKHYILIFSFLVSTIALSQTKNDLQLTFSEYLGYVTQFHPIAKQANLKLEEGQAYLIKARGGFDPKIEVDYNRKDFKDKEYYNLFNATFNSSNEAAAAAFDSSNIVPLLSSFSVVVVCWGNDPFVRAPLGEVVAPLLSFRR